LLNGHSVTDLIERRYSCRSYAETPIAAPARRELAAYLSAHTTGPFGSTVRLALIAATEGDRQSLKGLGTYGFIRNPMGFIAGAMDAAPDKNLEDFGWVLEQATLFATSLGLGTVWLGGTFTKSRFSHMMGLGPAESVPAVIATGYPVDGSRAWDLFIRRRAKADQRLPGNQLFFDTPGGGNTTFGKPLSEEGAGRYAEVLEMVRQGPSASNKQPWRIVRDGERWHFYLQRTRGYASRNALLGVADMQRIDMGIAMCHWQLTADELGLSGRWEVMEPPVTPHDDLTSYTATWVPGLVRPVIRQD
jgi:nitroreductase